MNTQHLALSVLREVSSFLILHEVSAKGRSDLMGFHKRDPSIGMF